MTTCGTPGALATMRDMRPRILFVSYNGLIEPLGPTQIVPYVRALAASYRMSLLSFEKPAHSPMEDAREQERLASLLRTSGIEWMRLRYHKWPSVPATLFDIAQGLLRVLCEHRRRRIDLVHARGYVPAAIAWGIKRLCGVPYLFDIRGLQVEEYLDANHWKRGSLAVRLTKHVERWLLKDADGMVTLTEAVRPILQAAPGLASRPILPPSEVIPCCVDLHHFQYREEARARIRSALGLGRRPVVVYSGSIGTWYLLDEMLACYKSMRRQWPEMAFLILSNAPESSVRHALSPSGLVEGRDVFIHRARWEEMPDYLSAADVGLALIRPCLSKRSSSPTKIGEYLACGLPVVVNAGIGDLDELVKQQRVGVLIWRLDATGYEEALPALAQFLGAPEATRRHCRSVAEEQFALHEGVRRYAALYARLLNRRRECAPDRPVGELPVAPGEPLHAQVGVQ